MALDLFTCGTVTSTNVVKGYEFEAKTYPLDQAVQLAKDVFLGAQILQGQGVLESEIPNPPPFRLVTLWEGIKGKVRLNAFQLKATPKSAATASVSTCGFFPGSTENDSRDYYLVTQLQVIHEEICAEQLINTYLRYTLPAGARHGMSPMLNDALVLSMLKAAKMSIDSHAFQGDWKNADTTITHADGFVKKAFNLVAAKVSQESFFQFAITSGHEITISIGGTKWKAPFNTDLPTTVTDLVAAINANLPRLANGTPMFAAITANNDGSGAVNGALYFETQPGLPVNIQAVIGVTATGFTGTTYCGASGDVLQAVTAPASGNTVAYTLSVEADGMNAPGAVAVEAITQTNVLDKMSAIYLLAQDTQPELMKDPNTYMAVAPNVFSAYKVKQILAQYTGSTFDPNTATFIDIRVVEIKSLKHDGIYIVNANHLHVGMDMMSDTQTMETGYEQKEGQFWFKMAYTLGFSLTRPEWFIGTLLNGAGAYANYHNYQAPAPTDYIHP